MSKCAKYDTLAVREWCQINWPYHEGSRNILFGALIFNWRGAMSSRSTTMCKQVGISVADTVLMAVCVVEQGWKICRFFHRGTASW
jgi:hypothetical protein